jgi:hypothetical protein
MWIKARLEMDTAYVKEASRNDVIFKSVHISLPSHEVSAWELELTTDLCLHQDQEEEILRCQHKVVEPQALILSWLVISPLSYPFKHKAQA